MGRNGMGKTTLIRSLLGLLSPVAGTVLLDGSDATAMKPFQRARAGIATVPEGRGIFARLSVRENLRFAAQPGGAWTEDRVLSLFPRLAERIAHRGNHLSGGEQQMLAIGRALMTNPQLLILDEATEGLAPVIRQAIWKVLAALKGARQSILLIDKNLKEVVGLADRHYVIERGQVRWNGTSADLKANYAEVQTLVGV
jgi:branched-chain amino acid transport system ATP-binding protein